MKQPELCQLELLTTQLFPANVTIITLHGPIKACSISGYLSPVKHGCLVCSHALKFYGVNKQH